jgi:hypothetical protein
MSALWPDTIVEEANVAYNISALRKALGDDRGDAKFIETVPTRGYRFVAPVVEAPSASTLPDFRGRRWGSVVARLTAPLVATVVVGSAAAAWLLLRSPGRPEAPPMRLVPLTTLTGLEGEPTFSPDGEQVAFAWNGAKLEQASSSVSAVAHSSGRFLMSENVRWFYSPVEGRDEAHRNPRGDYRRLVDARLGRRTGAITW